MRTTVLLTLKLLYLRKLHEKGESFTPGRTRLCQKHWSTCDTTDGQNKIAPQSEGRIGKVKTRTLLVMRKSNTPLICWCYCLQFVVDCMNHSSVKSLYWKTPMEKLHEKTPTFPCSDSASGPLCGTTNPQQNSRRQTFSQRNT